MMRFALRTAAFVWAMGVATEVAAHQLNVFASTDCETVVVEAKYSSGRIPKIGEVRVRDGADQLIATMELGENGTSRIPMADLDASTGLKIEVEAGHHDNFWILTPDDIAESCQS